MFHSELLLYTHQMVKSERLTEPNISEDVEQLELVYSQFGKQAVHSKLTYIFHMTLQAHS